LFNKNERNPDTLSAQRNLARAPFECRADHRNEPEPSDDLLANSSSRLFACITIWRRGGRAATFLTSTLYPVPGSNPAQTIGPLTTYDLNGDGRADLLFIDPIAVAILVELGNGNATFQSPVSSPIAAAFASGSSSMVAGDFNGDGITDILLYTPANGQIMFGNGDGYFRPGPSPALGFSANLGSITIYPAKLNGDRATDVFVSGVAKNSTVYGNVGSPFSYSVLNNGDGTFGNPIPSGIQYQPESPVAEIIIADVNGDGISDLIVYGTIAGGFQISLSNGDGTLRQLSPQASTFDYMDTADFNHDGKPDLLGITTSNVVVLLGNGDGTFWVAGTSSIYLSGSIGVADVNGDGLLDLVEENPSPYTTIALGGPNFTFPKASYFATLGGVAGIADVNSDGKTDVIGTGTFNPYSSASVSGHYTIMFGQSTSVLQAPKLATSSLGFNAGVTADFNGDGIPDIVAAGLNTSPYFLKGSGDGTFALPVAVPLTGTVENLASADFNRDGTPDLAVLTYAFNGVGDQYSLSILPGNGDGTFQQPLAAPFPVTTGSNFYSGPMKVGDFNHDRIPDIFVVNVANGANSLYVLLGNGDGTFRAVENSLDGTTNGYSGPRDAATADSNGDLILFWAYAQTNPTQNRAEILLNNGDGTFQSGGSYYPLAPEDPGSAAIAVGDVNGDDVPDLVVIESYNAQPVSLAVLLGTGNHTFAAAPVYIPLSFSEGVAVALADMNNDGNLDIVLDNEVLSGNGDGTFQPAIFLGGGVSSSSYVSTNGDLTIVDVNGDGKPDVIIGLEVILNITPSPSCASNPGGQIGVVSGGFQFNHATQSFVQTVTLTNRGQQPVGGPVVLVLDSLSSNAALRGAGGVTQCNSPLGSPWIQVAAGALAAGQSASVALTFYDPTEQSIHYNTRVLQGIGPP
jgi:hypothetical protein